MAAPTIPSLIILYLMLIYVLARKKNISLGSTLISSENSKWVSPNGQFAFGFYAITLTLYVVGVWFDDIPTKSLACTAMKDRRDIPVEKMFTLQLTNSGLILYDDQNNTKWSSGQTNSVVIQSCCNAG
ncbi:hypothetical protein SUGI_0018660 [Cryptomeria japonica]|nr:hypothetical protein SUGI_0018660 [Cryptomeria japonica]